MEIETKVFARVTYYILNEFGRHHGYLQAKVDKK
jgi:hypothetical protein